MHIIYEDDTLRLETLKPGPVPAGGTVLLSFPGIGQAVELIDVQQPEFAGSGRNCSNVIFCYDKTRSWGNRLDWDALTRTVLEAAGGCTLFSIGNSMGGYLAIVASAFLPIERSIAFVPQFSVDPEAAPGDRRWRVYSKSIKSFPMKPAGHYFVPETEYFIFSSGTGMDGQHAQLFPKGGNIHHWLFPGAVHSLAADLKERGDLDSCIQASLAGDTNLSFSQPSEKLSPAAAPGHLVPHAARLPLPALGSGSGLTGAV
ncbi:hypothetical protein K3725_01635 [Leisingera sp. S132]|uniref:hypothetical protein n=1 Tax=Leisingera sp. S132 TaxID=2867016 RepID=UPI0021A5FA4D|nr:hypothetical protein [Leisingera sp. S132]UWQ79735.1 hypothetical protein K3725_01635 [Leisingera sp. S132]